MIWIFLLIWLAPIVIYILVAWLILPKGSTVSDLINIFNKPSPHPYIPPLIMIVFPGFGLIALPISIIWFMWELFSEILSNCNTRIK